MKSFSSFLTLALGVGFMGNLALAADMAATNGPAMTPPVEAQPIKWLTPEQVQTLVDSAPKPAEPGSDPDKVDLGVILQVQAARTDAMIAECKRDQKFGYALFQPVYGDNLTPENSPKFFALMKDVLQATRAVNDGAKNKFKRLRPYQGHPNQVHALFDVEGYSYPSGHSMGSFTLAEVLGAVFPDKAKAFLDRAQQIARSRVDAGVHYPSDIMEGRILGKATASAIMANPDFQKDLAAVQAEVKVK